MARVDVIVNGLPLTVWKEVTIDRDYDKAVGQASIQFSEQPGKPCPMKLGDKCQVLIDGRPVVTGHAHDFYGDHGWENHPMTCVVRDKAQDAVDSTVGPKLKLKSPITLKQAAERTLGVMGLSDIKVIDEVGPEPFQKGEVISASIDDKGFSMLDQWAQKRQVLWGGDGKGNLVIQRNKQKRAPAYLTKLFEDSPVNNVKRGVFRNSDLERHNQVAVNGQRSPNDKDWWESKPKSERLGQADPTQKNWGSAYDTEVRPTRRLHARGSKGLAGDSPKKAAKWRSSAARKKGFQYVGTVQGFYCNGWLWWPGFIIPVIDQHFEIAADLLIVTVKFKKNWEGGEVTDVTCTLPDAFTTEPGGSKSASRTGKFGAGSVEPGKYGESEPPDTKDYSK